MAGRTQKRSAAQIREHYEVEKEIAGRLRNASRLERRLLYKSAYDERIRRIPHHPLLRQSLDPEAQAQAIVPQLRLLRSLVDQNTIFLEVGPGDCALAMAMAKHVQKVYAVDVSAALLQLRPEGPQNFEFSLSDGIEITVPAHSIQVAYSNQVMEHLHPDDARDQLRSIYNALAPGGLYLCITPNRISGPWDISRTFDDVASGLHLREYSVTELAQALASAGFSRVCVFVSVKGYHLSPMLPVAPVAWIEWVIQRFPRPLSRRLAHGLTAIKVVGIK